MTAVDRGSGLPHHRAMPWSPRRSVVWSPALLVALLACATGEGDDGDDAFVTETSTTTPTTLTTSTTDASTVSATMSSTTDPTDADASAEGTTTGGTADVPAECMIGQLDCPCDEGTCDEPALCVDDVCVAPMVCDPDANEPNDFDDDATDLGEISDDDAEVVEFAGVLDDADDVDWFTYHGTDVLGETVDPARALQVVGGTVELCKFFTCDVGEAQIVCPGGTMGVTEGLRSGCCGPGSFAFDEDGIECVGGAFETGGTVLVRVSNASAQCVEYSGTAHF